MEVLSEAPRISSGTFGFVYVHSGATLGIPSHSGSRGFPRADLEVVRFIRARVGSLVRA